MAAARASKARWYEGRPLSPFDGVPATIKDIVAIDGWSVRYGSTTTQAEPCTQDAPSVARMRAAGLVFLGATTTPEFGWKAVTDSPAFGVTRNPWDASLTPGGSSGGAAVAAATGAGVFHLGTDGGGSIRIPAAFTGISGLKPTFGRVPAYPASPFGTVAHIGPMCRRPGDVEAMLGLMSGRDPADWLQGAGDLKALEPKTLTPKGRKIGVWRRPAAGTVAPEIAAQFDSTVSLFDAAGAELIEFDLPMRDQLLEIFNWHWISSAHYRLSLAPDDDPAQFDPGLYEMAQAANNWTAPDYVAHASQRMIYGSAMNRALEDLDFLISPTAAILPFAAGAEVPAGSGMARWIEWAGFSYPINLSQQPAISVPAGPSSVRVPHALQIVGGLGRDSDVLGLAKWWHDRHPDYFL